MGILEHYAKRRKKAGASKVISVRLPIEDYKLFQAHCDLLGLSINEGVNLLVKHEIKDIKEEKIQKTYIEPTNITTNNLQNKYNSITSVGKETTNSSFNVGDKNYNSSQSVGKKPTKKFLKAPFEVDGELYCPICNSWQSSSNFARHAKSHNSTTEDIFTSPLYADKVKSMIANRIRKEIDKNL